MNRPEKFSVTATTLASGVISTVSHSSPHPLFSLDLISAGPLIVALESINLWLPRKTYWHFVADNEMKSGKVKGFPYFKPRTQLQWRCRKYLSMISGVITGELALLKCSSIRAS